jgi:hypothetical protein
MCFLDLIGGLNLLSQNALQYVPFDAFSGWFDF